MSSPGPELLTQEICSDIFQTIYEKVDTACDSNREFNSSGDFSDDVIANLLDQMVQILPPEERNIFGSADGKNIEEIIQEANELIRSTTPLFSSSESYVRSLSSSDKKESISYKKNPSSNKERSETVSLCSGSESIIVQTNFLDNNEVEYNSVECQKDESTEQMITNESPASPSYLEVVEKDNVGLILSSNLRVEEEQSTYIGPRVETGKDNSPNIANINMLVCTLNENHRDSDFKMESMGLKDMTDVKTLKIDHFTKVNEYADERLQLNSKIKDVGRNESIETNVFGKTSDLESLENEIKSQEQILIGYERENKKLCKEMSSLKEIWKQRECVLQEEKEQLQKELQEMISKVKTNLEEELKDAHETIVKLQIQLSTYKSKAKELEVSCNQLQEEQLRLQADLNQCRCDRTPCRRDKYSFLASDNIGTQIQQLKAVIARKDMEIYQLTSTVGMLRGDNMITQSLKDSQPGTTLNISQLQLALSEERQASNELATEKERLLKENLDLKRQVRELETIVKRRQKSESCFPVAQSSSRMVELEKELCSRQEALSSLHLQFVDMQKKYEDHIEELKYRLKETKEELQALKLNQKKEQSVNSKLLKKSKPINTAVKEETHLLATIRGLRQEASNREKEMNKLIKELEEVKLTNRKLQKEREKQLNAIPNKIVTLREKAMLKKFDKINSNPESQGNPMTPNNNMNLTVVAKLQEANDLLKSKTKVLQEEVKRLEQDLIVMHNKHAHELNNLQIEYEGEISRTIQERSAFLSQGTTAEIQGQLYTQQMVINHLKDRLKQMEELKNELTLLRAERDQLEENLQAVNKKMCYLQTLQSQSPESVQYKTLLEKLETLEKNQEIREQKLNSVRELLSRTTQSHNQGTCKGTCRDKLLDKNRQICFYRAQMDRILESLLDIRRTK